VNVAQLLSLGKKVKFVILVLVGALAGGCASHLRSPASVVRQADPVLGRAPDVRRFESRLNELGATIEKGATTEERVAIVALPGKPGYFPPRTLRVVYVITDKGLIEVRSAEVTALGARFVGRVTHR
jgi:hypothetical protein